MPPDAPAWIPVLQWWVRHKGNEHWILCSVIREPDGLRLEFSTDHPNRDYLPKAIKEVTGLDLEVVFTSDMAGPVA